MMRLETACHIYYRVRMKERDILGKVRCRGLLTRLGG